MKRSFIHAAVILFPFTLSLAEVPPGESKIESPNKSEAPIEPVGESGFQSVFAFLPQSFREEVSGLIGEVRRIVAVVASVATTAEKTADAERPTVQAKGAETDNVEKVAAEEGESRRDSLATLRRIQTLRESASRQQMEQSALADHYRRQALIQRQQAAEFQRRAQESLQYELRRAQERQARQLRSYGIYQ